MKPFFTFLFIVLAFSVTAQIPEPAMLWLRGYGGNGFNNVGTFVTTTNDGGFIVGIGTNAIPGSGNIDSFCSSSLSGDREIYLKYNADASILEWSKCFINGGFIFPVSNNDFIYGTNTDPATGWAFVIGREDSNGTIIWSKTYGDSADAILYCMLATNDGGYIMVGETNYTDSDFPIHYGTWTDADIAVIKVDSNGNKVWSKVIGGSSEDDVVSVIAAPDDGCYIVGTTLSNDHDCTGNHGGDDVYLVRLDKNGNIVWHNDIGGSGGDQGNYAATDGSGGVVIAGASNSPDGDRTHFPSYGCPVWVLQVDSNNNILWNNCYGGGGSNCYPNAICKAIDGSIWIAAVSTLIGGQVDTQYGGDDAWFLHISDTGNVINAKVLGSNQDDRGMMVYPLSNGNVIAGGFYNDPNGSFSGIPWYGGTDAFLTVFEPSPENVTKISAISSGVKIYPNPANEIITIKTEQTGNYDLVITDEIGHQIYTARIIEKIEISVNDWVKGMYYVQVINSDGYKEVQKLVIE